MDGSASDSWYAQSAVNPLGPTDPVQFGRFRVIGLLGSGRLGDSFLASWGEQMAVIKAIRPNTANMLELRDQMSRELAAIGRIQSPFVAPILAADVNAERPWVARQYIPGVTLERGVADNGPVPQSALLVLACQLAQGLESVHAAGVVHRDLRPANVMLSPRGPCLVDFGMVDVAEPSRLSHFRSAQRPLVWLAPEQVAGQRATPATDVHGWALVVLFAATGRPPFPAAKPAANAHPRLPKGTPRALSALVSGALVKDPRRRPDISEVRATLESLVASQGAAGLEQYELGRAAPSQVAPLPAQPLPAQLSPSGQPPAPPARSAPTQTPPTQTPPSPGPIPSSGAAAPPWQGREGSGSAHQSLPPRPRRVSSTVKWAVGGALAIRAVAAVALVLMLRHDLVSDPGVVAGSDPAAAASHSSKLAEPAPSTWPTATATATATGQLQTPQPVTQPPAVDPTGTWTGSSVSSDGRYTYQVRLVLQGDPAYPSGTVSLRNIASGNEGGWEVTGSWRDGQLRLEPGVWLNRPNSSWVREALILVPLSDTHLVGTTTDPTDPANPTGNVDLYR